MPSPPLVPDDGSIDLAHLRRMTLGDDRLKREVLAMFAGQATGLIGKLAALPADASTLAHKLKGSARAVGAFQVSDAAAMLETVILDGGDATDVLTLLDDAVKQARAAIDAILRRS